MTSPSTPVLPRTIFEHARRMYEHTLTMTEDMTRQEAARFPGFTLDDQKGDLAFIRLYLRSMDIDAPDALTFRQGAEAFSRLARKSLRDMRCASLRRSEVIPLEYESDDLPPPMEMSGATGTDSLGDSPLAGDHDLLYRNKAKNRLEGWLHLWEVFDRLWQACTDFSVRVVPATGQQSADNQAPVLTADQSRAADHLTGIFNARLATCGRQMPLGLLPRWTVPLLVGGASSGKSFVCEEVARRNQRAYQRWEIGSWLVSATRSACGTLDEINKFIQTNPQGCVVYLTGIDTLASSRRSGDQKNVGYLNAVIAEVEYFLHAQSRRVLSGQPVGQIVVGGRFAALWGETDMETEGGAEAWKSADREPITNREAVARWLSEQAGLPTGITRYLSLEPLVIDRINRDEARGIAAMLHRLIPEAAAFPDSLDGLAPMLAAVSVGQIADALCGPHGWRGVAALFERTLIAAHLPDGEPAAFLSDARLHPPSEPGGDDLTVYSKR